MNVYHVQFTGTLFSSFYSTLYSMFFTFMLFRNFFFQLSCYYFQVQSYDGKTVVNFLLFSHIVNNLIEEKKFNKLNSIFSFNLVFGFIVVLDNSI